MPEKMEQSKEFIEEFKAVKFVSVGWISSGLHTVNTNTDKYPLLHKWLFTGNSNNDNINQITFAKIWAGEIELVEKKPKYVIYQEYKGDYEQLKGKVVPYKTNNYGFFSDTFFYDSLKDLLDSINSCGDKRMLFDQEFAFALKDTEKFEIAEVVG